MTTSISSKALGNYTKERKMKVEENKSKKKTNKKNIYIVYAHRSDESSQKKELDFYLK